ncbi:MAG TPA: hypothetical protein HA362_07815 [Nanoarchaeota archaeon]|nr:hypothetical protein [Nanoarchaeota archaeon]
MEKLKQLVAEANREFQKADHLAYVTFPMIKETKLLYIIAEVLYNSLAKGVAAVLEYERLYKRVPLVPGPFEMELELFKSECVNRYGFNRNIVLLMLDLKSIVQAKKESPVEFSRQGKFVICGEDYSMNVLDIQKMKLYVMEGREFMAKINHVLRAVVAK